MRIVRWGLLGLTVIVIVALVAVLGLLAAVTGRGLPQTSGTLRIDGLHAPVAVIRDRAGIIQIRADDPHDLFLAQGYAHAQERMWQMEVWRHISAGRLSELFGEASLDTDKFIRTLDWRGAAQRDLDAMPQDVRDALQAYADGVNAWLADHAGSFGPPFVVAGLLAGTGGIGGYTPEPWTPLDSAAWQKVQAWNLGGNMDTEIFRLLADARLGDPARTDQLFPAYDADAPVITPSGLAGSGGAGATGATAAAIEHPAGDRHGAPRRAAPLGQRRGGMARRRRPRGRDPRPGRPRRRLRPGREPRDRLEQLGRLGIAVGDRRGAPRQRPAPRLLHAERLDHERAPLPRGQRRVPVRRHRRLLPGGPGGRPGPQRAGRVGRDERRPGRPGPLPRDRRSGRPDPLPLQGRVDPVRRPNGDDQGRRRRRRHDRGPVHAPRPHPQRRRLPARAGGADRPRSGRRSTRQTGRSPRSSG